MLLDGQTTNSFLNKTIWFHVKFDTRHLPKKLEHNVNDVRRKYIVFFLPWGRGVEKNTNIILYSHFLLNVDNLIVFLLMLQK